MSEQTGAKRRLGSQRGFSFIEILVVMGIIAVLVSMVVVVVPWVQEKGKRTKSQDNLRSLAMFMTSEVTEKGWKRFPYSGKNFTLAPIALGLLDRRNVENLAILFSPGDTEFGIEFIGDTKESYRAVTKAALKRGSEDFSNLTSYAGRRNGDRDYRIGADDASRGVIIMADDDEGPVHHKAGFVAVYSNNSVKFHEWDDFGLIEPEDPKHPDAWLGDDAQNDDLAALSSR